MVTERLISQTGDTKVDCVKKEYVHKSFNENNFVTSIEAISERLFKVEGPLPVNHILYNDQISGLSACPYFVELSRQSNMAICHLFFNINLSANFTMIGVDWNFTGQQPFLPKNFDPIIYNVEFATYKERKNFTIVKIIGNLYQKGENFLNGESTFLFTDKILDETDSEPEVAPFVQKRSPADPEVLQVSRMENALVTAPEYDKKNDVIKTYMVIDDTHTYFYEHPCVHIPGMMLMEAGKQSAVAGLKTKFDFLEGQYGDFKEGKIVFSNFASPRSEVSIEVKPQEPNVHENYVHIPVSVIFHQDDRELGSIESIATFMSEKEAISKSVYTPRRSNRFIDS